jgi:hypothetical protein
VFAVFRWAARISADLFNMRRRRHVVHLLMMTLSTIGKLMAVLASEMDLGNESFLS